MESAKSKQSGSCSRNIFSTVVLGDFSGKSRGTDKYDTTKLVDAGVIRSADVGSVLGGNLLSLTRVKKEEFFSHCGEEDHQTSVAVLHDGLERCKALEVGSGEGTAKEMLSSLEAGEANIKETLGFGQMVWGKVSSYPWWPGQIYDESLVPSQVRNTKREGSVLVAFFGDCSYAWLDHDEIIPFEPHFEEKSKKSKSWNFPVAVEEAVEELERRAALGLTCFCQHPGNFLPTRIEGLYKVDVSGHEPGAIYSSKQINISRDGFQPQGILTFVKRLAKSPRSMQNVDRIINCAKVTAYRKAVFNENDDPYDEAFDELEKDDETYNLALGVKASNSVNPVEFPEEGNQLEGTTSTQAIAEAPNTPSALVMPGEIADLERNDSITLEIPCTDIASDKSGPATLNHEHKGMPLEVSKALDKSKSSQALYEPIMVTEERLQNVKFPTLLFDASVPKNEENSLKDRGDYSNNSCRKETKRKRMEESPPNDEEHTGNFRTDAFFDTLVAKSADETDRIYCSKGREIGKKKKNNGVNEYAASNSKSTVCDYQEVDACSFVKVNIGCENSQEVLSEILCASSSACSSIDYKQKVGTLDATVAAINRKYSMDEGWKSHYQQNLTAINNSDISHQLTNLLQKCNELLSGIEGSQDQFSNQS